MVPLVCGLPHWLINLWDYRLIPDVLRLIGIGHPYIPDCWTEAQMGMPLDWAQVHTWAPPNTFLTWGFRRACSGIQSPLPLSGGFHEGDIGAWFWRIRRHFQEGERQHDFFFICPSDISQRARASPGFPYWRWQAATNWLKGRSGLVLKLHLQSKGTITIYILFYEKIKAIFPKIFLLTYCTRLRENFLKIGINFF